MAHLGKWHCPPQIKGLYLLLHFLWSPHPLLWSFLSAPLQNTSFSLCPLPQSSMAQAAHLRGPSLLPFPVGSKFPLASKVLSWFPSQAFAVLLPLMVPWLTPSSLRSHLSSRFLWEISSSHLQSQLLIFSTALAYLSLIVLVRNGYHLTSLPVYFLSFTWR